MLIIKSVQSRIAKKLKLKKNYKILSFNGEVAEDFLDYIYFDSKDNFLMEIENEKGNKSTLQINKNCDETLGLSFYNDNLEIKRCKNNCIFCFVKQLPANMRDSLYIKDDDWRMSFLYGNFVTLTNLTKEEKNKIIRRKISPLYISVHSMNLEVRKSILGINKNCDIKPLLKEFHENNIKMHCQIVVCPGINDGNDLQNSLNELYMLRPEVESVAIVPVGLSKFRKNLPYIKPVDKQSAKDIIELVDKFNNHIGFKFACIADELYLKAEVPIPKESDYGDYPQLENGVGMLRLFESQFNDEYECDNFNPQKRRVLVVTGTSAFEFINKLCDKIRKRFEIDIICKEIINNFFGDSVTVSGLLTGKDILEQTKNLTADEILLPENCLKDNEIFLDDITLNEFKKIKNCKVTVTENNGADFLRKVIGDC